jgi:hypothetical protein
VAVQKIIPRTFVRPQFERVLFSIIGSPGRIVAAAVLFGASAALLEYIAHLVVWTLQPQLQGIGDAFLLGLMASVFLAVIAIAARERHYKVENDLRRIAEINHQVRNALQVIVYGEYSAESAQHRPAVLAGVAKIEAALKELFPLVGERADDRSWEAHNKNTRLQVINRAQAPDRRQQMNSQD